MHHEFNFTRIDLTNTGPKGVSGSLDDARNFLFRLSTLKQVDLSFDNSAQNTKHAPLGFFLNEKAQIIGSFLFHHRPDRLTLYTLDADSLIAHIEKMQFSEEFKIEASTAVVRIGINQNSKRNANDLFSIEELSTKTEITPLEPFENFRIQNGIPWFANEINPGRNPVDLGLRFLFEEQKGCYPGQEVIEKIISFGKPARILSQIELSHQQVESKQSAQGLVTTLATSHASPQETLTTTLLCGPLSEQIKGLAMIRRVDATVGAQVTLEHFSGDKVHLLKATITKIYP